MSVFVDSYTTFLEFTAYTFLLGLLLSGGEELSIAFMFLELMYPGEKFLEKDYFMEFKFERQLALEVLSTEMPPKFISLS